MSGEPGDDREQLDYLSFVDYAVARTARELPDIDALAMRFVLTLHRATSALVYDLESSVHRPRGLTWPGFRLLFVLWLAGPAEAKRVAELTGMSRAAVSALVKTLEREGLVCRRQVAHDRRSVQLALTEVGRVAIADAFAAHNAREQDWVGVLSESEVVTLIGLLGKLMAGSARIAARRRS